MKENFVVFNNIQELVNISSFLFGKLGRDKESPNHMWHTQFQCQFLPKIWSVFASGLVQKDIALTIFKVILPLPLSL